MVGVGGGWGRRGECMMGGIAQVSGEEAARTSHSLPACGLAGMPVAAPFEGRRGDGPHIYLLGLTPVASP